MLWVTHTKLVLLRVTLDIIILQKLPCLRSPPQALKTKTEHIMVPKSIQKAQLADLIEHQLSDVLCLYTYAMVTTKTGK